MKYDKEYFIKKIEAIPKENIGQYTTEGDKPCILGHCGARCPGLTYIHTEESKALVDLFGSTGKVETVNDSYELYGCQSPKESLLKYLKQ